MRMATTERIALLACLLLAINPLDVWYAQEGRWYAQWSALCVLSWLALFSALRSGAFRHWAAYAASVAASVYTFILTPLTVAAQIAAGIVADRSHDECDRWPLRAFALSLLAVAAASAPVIWVVVSELGHGSGTPRPLLLSVLPYTFFVYCAGLTYGPSVFELHALPHPLEVLSKYPSITLIFVAYGVLTLAGMRSLYARGLFGRAVILWAVSAPCLLFVVALASDVAYNVRYTLSSLPAFVAILAAGILSLKTRARRLLALAVVVAICAVSLNNYYTDSRYDRPHVKAALGHVLKTDGRRSNVLSLGQIDLPAQYYGERMGMSVNTRCQTFSDAGQAPAESHPLWVLVGQDYAKTSSACLVKLRSRYRILERRNVPGVELWRLRPKSGSPPQHTNT